MWKSTSLYLEMWKSTSLHLEILQNVCVVNKSGLRTGAQLRLKGAQSAKKETKHLLKTDCSHLNLSLFLNVSSTCQSLSFTADLFCCLFFILQRYDSNFQLEPNKTQLIIAEVCVDWNAPLLPTHAPSPLPRCPRGETTEFNNLCLCSENPSSSPARMLLRALKLAVEFR